MIDKENKFFKRLFSVFEDSYINDNNEFIALLQYYPSDHISWFELIKMNRKGTRPIFVNEYFRLEDCETELDIKKKILFWLSRVCCKTQYSSSFDKYIHEYFRERCNTLLNVNFNEEQWTKIYTKFGNGCNEKLCIKFIESYFDMNLLK